MTQVIAKRSTNRGGPKNEVRITSKKQGYHKTNDTNDADISNQKHELDNPNVQLMEKVEATQDNMMISSSCRRTMEEQTNDDSYM
ncbi:hypothetical protein ACS0TY_002090 [Phlomoides rotata]